MIRWWHLLVFVAHRGLCCGLAALIVVSGDVLGVRWSYHKFEFGKQVKWIGLLWNFCIWATLLPADKLRKAASFLDKITSGKRLDRKSVASGASFML